MAMDKDRLGNAMADAVLTCVPSSPVGADETKLRALMILLADEIIKEIIGNAVVTTTTLTPGAQAGPTTLPGTGTGTVTA